MLKTLDLPTGAGTRPLVARFAGDSGDGIQLLGAEFAKSTAEVPADFMTFPDYPAEIRAPAGTLFGVSAYQIQFGADEVLTSGDDADVLVVFNPAALKTNLSYLKRGGLLIADASAFDTRGLKKAEIETNPLEDGSLSGYQLLPVEITTRTLEALAPFQIGRKQAARAKNFWVLGLLYWLFDREIEPTITWLEKKFTSDPSIAETNTAALKAGHAYGDTLELAAFPGLAAKSTPAPQRKGRIISGTDRKSVV